MPSSDEEIISKRQRVKIKPRPIIPKPRRALATSQSNTQTETANDSGTEKQIKQSSFCEDDDEDGFFTKKTFTWKPTAEETTENNTLGEEQTVTDETVAGNRKQRTNGRKHRRKFDWTKSVDQIVIDCDEASDDNLSDISDGVAELISITRKQKKVNDAMDVTVERVTVTPPPMLDHLAVRSSMNGLQSTSNELLSDVSCSQFDTELDPGLISLAQQAKRKDVQNHEGDKVRVLVRLVYHPETVVDDHNRAAISQYERPMIFIMRLEDNFEKLITHFCEAKKIQKQDLVITYDEVKVFPRSTPASLGMNKYAEIVAFEKTIYDYLQLQKAAERERKLKETELLTSEYDTPTPVDDFEEQIEDMLHLKLKSRDGSVEKLKMKRSEIISTVIAKYRSIKKLLPGAQVQLTFEGELLDPLQKLEDTELEDGDMLMVMG
ncbi:8978_t:CDS:2 [Paraglomus brasilianum]|uniref:8978_t:CDS:1 n=1 Tax=Paraglomus brasilianum TaxID=144538 RepID=A0A9N9AA42_9GLOM|nr:8978_t:CDS:2 [Paraglomus brasilianum]